MSIEILREEGLRWVEANRSKRFSGITKLLTDLYPDNAHFIYELLQNAEDARDKSIPNSAGASMARFTLTEDALEFEHNGEGLFTLNDVDSITSIGDSSKRDDPTSIGKFGIGFKAVFSYTNTPEIHSGEFHFRIHDLVVPETEGVAQYCLNEQETRFIFPFNNPKKPSQKAIAEIEQGLRALGDNTLLFLRHIERIEYRLTDGTLGSLQRLDHGNDHVEIISSCGGRKDSSHWLRFQKNVEITDEKGKTKEFLIAIAYKLEEDKDNWKIVPVEGEVSIYFPAEKTSNLRFHLQAPFASTVARDCVRNCSENKELRDQLATLVVESLLDIREQEMLTVNFLEVLPNPEDDLPEFYKPIRKAIVKAFKNEDLTPTKNGSHAPASELYTDSTDRTSISNVLKDDDIALLAGGEPPLWAANPPRKSRQESFLDSLEIEEWGWYELSNAICWLDDDKRKTIEDWIAQKDDAWLLRFYALLGEASDQDGGYFQVEDLRVVRVEFESGHDHVLPSEAFFPPDQETMPINRIHFVKPDVYSRGRASETQKTRARSFLEHIGVRSYDEKASIELRLKELSDNPPENIGTQHFEDIKRFIAFWKKNPTAANIFQNQSFLLVTFASFDLNWRKPTDVCLDLPYDETGLAKLMIIHGKYALWDGYEKKLSASMLKDFVSFVKAIGVMHDLQVESVSTCDNPHKHDLWQDYRKWGVKWTTTAINEDYSIPGIVQYLGTQSVLVSRLVWDALLRAERKSSKARFRPNQQHTTREEESQLVFHLKDHAWIPDRTGVFRKPEDMTKDELRTDFPFDNRNELLTAIGFGEHANKQTSIYRAQNDAAKEMGFDSAEEAKVAVELAQLARETGKPLSELRSIFQHHHPELPEKSVKKPITYIKKVLEDWSNAPTSESEIRDRTIQVGLEAEVFEAKEYLRNLYENPDGQLICQSCHEEMPFKVGEKYYFEAIQYVRGLVKRHRASRIALCPNCAAKYQHAKETSDDEIRRRLIELGADENTSSVSIPVRLAGRECSLYFVGSHWLALKAILSVN